MARYRWDAQDYAQSSAAQQLWAREMIAKLELRGDERVLDIGCGDGKVTAEIARQVPNGEVLGIDNASEMVFHAAKAYATDGHGNLRFLCADATALPFSEGFDVAFSNATLHWVLDHMAVLRGIAGCLRPGGKALLQMGGEGNAAEIVATIDEMREEARWQPYFRDLGFTYAFYGPVGYANWLLEAGLQPVRAELIPKDMAQRGADGLAAWVRTTWLPYTQRVPEELREAFVGELVARYLATHPLDADGLAHVGMMRLEVLAERSA